ncbi:MAG: response regulator [Nitrospirae bacterium]|nr:response regulator [Nitrospirota bacterium]MBF0536191.1 response regulator [Nitrospirota bacterium]
MKVLIAEDDFISRQLLQKLLSAYGQCDVVVNGKEAIEAHAYALESNEPYDLICLDVMMPEVDGMEALKAIRAKEISCGISLEHEVRIVMTTALDSPRDILEAHYGGGCTDYLVKPLDTKKLLKLLSSYGLID